MHSDRGSIGEFLASQCAAGPWRIGQVLVAPSLHLCHADDTGRQDLTEFTRPEDAREIAKYDAAGAYRPLKTAPNLKHGWQLRLAGVDELRHALDFLYPAAVGAWLVYRRGELRPVPLRETLGRQTGMYHVTQWITDDQACKLIQSTCSSMSGCLRRPLWALEPGKPHPLTERALETQPGEVPIPCAEACNVLVAACRPIAKANLPKVK
jgi:sirohydrochlorin cobaltochelatase